MSYLYVFLLTHSHNYQQFATTSRSSCSACELPKRLPLCLFFFTCVPVGPPALKHIYGHRHTHTHTHRDSSCRRQLCLATPFAAGRLSCTLCQLFMGPGSAEGGLAPMIYIQSHHGGSGGAAGQVREAGAAFRRFFSAECASRTQTQ